MSIRRKAMLAILTFVGLASAPVQAGGRVSIGVGIGVPGPFYYRPYPYHYRPYYYAPYPAVYVAPRPIYVVPPPQPVYVQPGVYQAAPGYAFSPHTWQIVDEHMGYHSFDPPPAD